MSDVGAQGAPANVEALHDRPVPRALRALPPVVFGALVALVVSLVFVAVVLANPGHRVGEVRPASPPVGGQELPAATVPAD